MFEVYGLKKDLESISDKLDEIRRLSTGLIPNYYDAPYSDDWALLQNLLDEKIEFLRKESN
jgi:hypothetical protein